MATLRIALTTGEPAGIGPDLAVQPAQRAQGHELVVIADPQLLEERARLLNLPLSLQHYHANTPPGGSGPELGRCATSSPNTPCPCDLARRAGSLMEWPG